MSGDMVDGQNWAIICGFQENVFYILMTDDKRTTDGRTDDERQKSSFKKSQVHQMTPK